MTINEVELRLKIFVSTYFLLTVALIVFSLLRLVTEMLIILLVINMLLLSLASWGMFMSVAITCYYLRAMYSFQKFEFKRHGLKVFLTGVTIIVAFFNLVAICAINTYAVEC